MTNLIDLAEQVISLAQVPETVEFVFYCQGEMGVRHIPTDKVPQAVLESIESMKRIASEYSETNHMRSNPYEVFPHHWDTLSGDKPKRRLKPDEIFSYYFMAYEEDEKSTDEACELFFKYARNQPADGRRLLLDMMNYKDNDKDVLKPASVASTYLYRDIARLVCKLS